MPRTTLLLVHRSVVFKIFFSTQQAWHVAHAVKSHGFCLFKLLARILWSVWRRLRDYGSSYQQSKLLNTGQGIFLATLYKRSCNLAYIERRETIYAWMVTLQSLIILPRFHSHTINHSLYVVMWMCGVMEWFIPIKNELLLFSTISAQNCTGQCKNCSRMNFQVVWDQINQQFNYSATFPFSLFSCQWICNTPTNIKYRYTREDLRGWGTSAGEPSLSSQQLNS